jgi:ribosomal protein S18 acetylase RimI-like enzyme
MAASGTSVEVRHADRHDGQALRDLAGRAYGHYVDRIGRRPAPMDADYEAAVRAGHVWVAEQDGRVIGLIVLVPSTDHLLVENVAVDPAQQGAGAGSRLLRHAEEVARAHGLYELRLYTHEQMTENLAFYRRRGFRETERRRELGFARVFFSKRIRP